MPSEGDQPRWRGPSPARQAGMKRKEQRRPGRDEAPPEGEPEAVVQQRTQVVLLGGEAWGPETPQALLSAFDAHHVLPPSDGPCGPAPTRALPAPDASRPCTAAPAAPPPPGPGQAGGQLVFLLCRPSSLRERLWRLREVLRGVREQSRSAPAVLVGVIVQPREDEEAEARRRLEELLREVFKPEGAAPFEVHTAIFKPGRAQGALDVRRVGGGLTRPQISEASDRWLDKSKWMQIFGALLSVGAVAYGGYYFYNNPPM